jgi:hypothetical protein
MTKIEIPDFDNISDEEIYNLYLGDKNLWFFATGYIGDNRIELGYLSDKNNIITKGIHRWNIKSLSIISEKKIKNLPMRLLEENELREDLMLRYKYICQEAPNEYIDGLSFNSYTKEKIIKHNKAIWLINFKKQYFSDI